MSVDSRSLRPRDTVGYGGDTMRKMLREAPVYHPSIEDMADFAGYVAKIVPKAAEFGICKVIPPKAWRSPPKEAPCGSFIVRGAINTHAVGSHGVYSLMHQVRKSSISYDHFARAAEAYAQRENVPPDASHDALEDKFWSELMGAKPPLYGADLDASLFAPDLTEWNLNLLPDLLRQGPSRLRQKMAGINTPMLYLGSFRSLFSLCAPGPHTRTRAHARHTSHERQKRNACMHGSPPNACTHGSLSNACMHGSPPNACMLGPPPNACTHGPPPNACMLGPLSNVCMHGPPPNACMHGPPPNAPTG